MQAAEPEGMTMEEIATIREAIERQARLTRTMFVVQALMGDANAAEQGRRFEEEVRAKDTDVPQEKMP